MNPPDFPRGEPDSDGVPDVLRDYVLVAPFNDTDYVCSLIREHRDELAAVIVEPFFRMIKPKPGFLEALRETTRECNVLLVFDEVVTGFRLAWAALRSSTACPLILRPWARLWWRIRSRRSGGSQRDHWTASTLP